MANAKIEIDHKAVERLLDDAFPEVKRQAEEIAKRANAMKSPKVEPYEVDSGRGPSKKYGYTGGRQYAVVAANHPSTIRDNAKNNTLLKARG